MVSPRFTIKKLFGSTRAYPKRRLLYPRTCGISGSAVTCFSSSLVTANCRIELSDQNPFTDFLPRAAGELFSPPACDRLMRALKNDALALMNIFRPCRVSLRLQRLNPRYCSCFFRLCGLATTAGDPEKSSKSRSGAIFPQLCKAFAIGTRRQREVCSLSSPIPEYPEILSKSLYGGIE